MTSSVPKEQGFTETTELGRSRSAIDTFCERTILALLLLILVFGPLALGAVRLLEFSVIQGLTMAILAFWGGRVWIASRYRFFWPPICWAVLAVACYAIVRFNLVEMPHIAREELYQVLVYTILFFAVINNVNRRESTTIVTVTLIVLAVGLSAFAFYQFASHNPHVWSFSKPSEYSSRATGTYINPNHFAGFLEMILPLALAYMLMGRFNHASKALLGYAALIIAAGIGVSLSRGGIIAAGVAIVLFLIVLLFQREYWLKAAILLGVIVLLTVIFVNAVPRAQMRFVETKITERGKSGNQDRTCYWENAWQVYQKNIIWGVGAGHFDQEFWPYRNPQVLGRPTFVHNDYLQTLCEWGAAGLALIFSALGFLFYGIKRTWRFVGPDPREIGGKKGSTKAAFLLGGAFGVLAILFHSVLDFNMHIPANAILAVVLMALLSVQLRFATERYWVNPRIFGKIIFTALILTAVYFIGPRAFQQARAGLALQRAENADTDSQRIAALKDAAQIEPDNFETAYDLGECLRLQSWEGKEGYQLQAQEALTWFRRAMDLNSYDPFSPLRYGMCLDWLGRHEEATPYFQRACKLDPNGNYVAAYEGWHYMQMEDYAAAKRSLERSMNLYGKDYAQVYLQLVNDKLAEAAKKEK